MADSLAAENDALKAKVKELEGRLERMSAAQGQDKVERVCIDKMSSEVVDSNPYSRLMALQRMGVVENYERIRDKSIVVIGLGGVGSVVCEMLTRCGVGRLIMFDYDTVELANMNRLFFRPEHAGFTKTDAATKTLREINPDVDFEPHTCDITGTDGFELFLNRVNTGGKGDRAGMSVDLVLGCVDNFQARVAINMACVENKQVWMESGVSENAMSGHIQLIEPGKSSCYQCAPPLIVADGDEKTLKRDGVCAASLPTTMGIIAGMLVQNTLKYLLEFGVVSTYLGYNAMKDFFHTTAMRANPQCDNRDCRKRQEEHAVWVKENPVVVVVKKAEEVPSTVNEWGITIEEDSEAAMEQTASAHPAPPSGLKYAHEIATPSTEDDSAAAAAAAAATVDDGVDLDDLQAQLKAM